MVLSAGYTTLIMKSAYFAKTEVGLIVASYYFMEKDDKYNFCMALHKFYTT